LKTNKVTGQIAAGQNPDDIGRAYTKRSSPANGRSNDSSVIDPVTEKVIATIPWA